MQRYTVNLYLETAPNVSGGNSTHHQKRTQLYLQHLVFVTPLLLPAAIVEELEQLFHDTDTDTVAIACAPDDGWSYYPKQVE
jgi:hypothetical protein